jgi:hypothetical protein
MFFTVSAFCPRPPVLLHTNLVSSLFLPLSCPSEISHLQPHASYLQQYRFVWTCWQHGWEEAWRYCTGIKDVLSSRLSARLPWLSTVESLRRLHVKERLSRVAQSVANFTLKRNPTLIGLNQQFRF